MRISREGFIAIFALIVAIFSLGIAMFALVYRTSPINESQEWKMKHVTPDAPLVKEVAESLGSLEIIHNFVEKKYAYVWEESDTWKFPQEMLESYRITGKLEGDCEDVALLEVSLFRAVGVPENQVRVVIFSYPSEEMRGIHAGIEFWRNDDWKLLRFDDPRGFWTEQILYPEEIRMFAFNDKLWWSY